jgi:glycosyltransferase involved in cell wall biosynthesis
MNKPPIVTIIMPSYNHGHYINDAITSVLSQQGNFYIDFIIMDGGSQDKTIDIIKKYEKLLTTKGKIVSYNGRHWYIKKNKAWNFCNCLGVSFRWTSEKDNGQSHAINKGLRLAIGDYIAWLNSDDYYTSSGVFKTVADFFRAHPACGMAYGRGYCVDARGNVIRDYHDNCSTLAFNRDILKYESFILQPATFMRREAVKAVGQLDETLHWCMDWDLWLRISASFDVQFIPAWLACWRQHNGIKSLEVDYAYNKERYSIIRRNSSFLNYIFNKWHFYMLYPGHLWGHMQLKYTTNKLAMAFFYTCAMLGHSLLKIPGRVFRKSFLQPGVQRLAIFTPMEPLKTGIATYFTKFIASLTREKPELFIDIFIDDGYEPFVPECARVRVMNHRFFPINSFYYNSIIYQVGNDTRFHAYMIPYVKKYRGVVEMHDIKIRAIYVSIMEVLKESLKNFNIVSSVKIFIKFPELMYFIITMLLGPIINKEQFLDRCFYRKTFAVRKSRKIIIRDVSLCSRFRLPQKKCASIIHGIDIKKLPRESEMASIRKRLGIGRDTFVIVTAGLIHNSKRVDKVFQALGDIKNILPDFMYILAGESIWEGCSLESLIRIHGLEKHVTVTGWTSNQEWFDYITIADVGINLRGNSSGEHSGPLVNFIERGKVILISDYDQYRIYPDEFAIKIGHGPDEVKAIADTLLWIKSNPQLVKHAGKTARKYAEEVLDFDNSIIKQYCKIMDLD